MNEDNRNAYSEVIEILKWIDDEKKLEALPMEMLELIKSKANSEYKPVISKEIPLEQQNLQPETFSILSWIAMKYWSEDINLEEGKTQEIKQELNTQTSIVQENNVQKVEDDINQITENTESINTEIQKSELPIAYSELKWYEKIKIRIINFFNNLFGKNKIQKSNKEEGQVL